MKVGLSERRIDPQPGAALGGYPDVHRPCVAHNDPLRLSAVWLECAEGTTVLLVVFDGIVVSPSLVESARRAAPAGTTVVVQASHTHSAPSLSVPHWDQGVIGEADPDYERWLAAQIAEAVAAAIAGTASGTVRVGRADLDAVVGANRRHPGLRGDPRVRVIEFRNDTASPVVLVLHGCHPTVLGPSNLHSTADLGLGLREGLRELGYDGTAHLAAGGAGDQSTRTTRTGSTFDEADRLGRLLANAAMRAIQSSQVQSDVVAATASVALPVRALPTVDTAQAEVNLLLAQRAILRNTGADAPAIRTLEVKLLGLGHDLRRARTWGSTMPSAPIDVVAIRLGEQVIVFTPLEPFLEVALALEATTGAWLAGYANDYRGYLLPDDEIAFGGYEFAASPFAFGSVGALQDAMARLVEML